MIRGGLGVVGLGRLELPTLRLSGVRSNHLSYRPMTAAQDGARPWARDRAAASNGRSDVLERETKTAAIRIYVLIAERLSDIRIGVVKHLDRYP